MGYTLSWKTGHVVSQWKKQHSLSSPVNNLVALLQVSLGYRMSNWTWYREAFTPNSMLYENVMFDVCDVSVYCFHNGQYCFIKRDCKSFRLLTVICDHPFLLFVWCVHSRGNQFHYRCKKGASFEHCFTMPKGYAYDHVIYQLLYMQVQWGNGTGDCHLREPFFTQYVHHSYSDNRSYIGHVRKGGYS